jgi:hypothetical protein
MNFVATQSRIERILLEDFPGATGRLFLGRRERVKTFPETLSRAVFHSAVRDGGLAPLRTASMSANCPAAASAIPCLNESGIQESSFSTTNLATCARSFGGRALMCSIISWTLMLKEYRTQLVVAKQILIAAPAPLFCCPSCPPWHAVA